MKKVIKLTESDLVKIVQKVINEQSEDRKEIMRQQKTLNFIFNNDKTFKKMTLGFMPLEVDGKTGPNSKTAQAIETMQSMLGVIPADGVWGESTMDVLRRKKPEWYQYWENSDPSLINRIIQKLTS